MTAKIYRGRYEALALMARGGQGEVWRARDHQHGRDVALKIRRVGAGERERILSEARTLLGMRPHPGLPVVRDDFFHGQRYVMVMDWIEGAPLDRAPEMPFEDVLSRLGEVARALDHLHAHDPPIVHRDVKPANVILTPDRRAVLVDLGLSAQAEPYGGTAAFVAPEVVRGEEATTSADVYGLAVTAYVLLTGSTPEPGREPDWSRVPSALRDQIRAGLGEALAIDPRLRPASAGALMLSLRPAQTANNLPAQLTSFVGRELAGAEVRRRLQGTRLLTLCGPGGCGKTRLAIRMAQSALPSFTGVWLAELAGVSDPAFVPDAVSHSLRVASERGRDVVECLTSFLGTGSQLLVLDNCEHLLDPCAHLCERLLRACAELRILATSREPLRAVGEVVFTVPPMDEHESVRLFNARAPQPQKRDAALVASICKRLDGIPLAIELAAARSVTTGLEQLDRGLDEALAVLTAGVRTVPRHETLRATIDWSFELLTFEERTALRRLSVFAGGFTSDAAGEVCAVEEELDRLADTSLLQRSGERFRMLETVRQYAAEKLGRSGETADFQGRHARWFADLTDRPHDEAAGLGRWLDMLELEHDNFLAALAYGIKSEPETAARIASRLWRYWQARGHWNEGRMWLERAASFADTLEPALRSRLLRDAGNMAHAQGDYALAAHRLEEALELSRAAEDRPGASSCLSSLAMIARDEADYPRARSLGEQSLAIWRELGHRRGIADVLTNLSAVLFDLGDYAGARERLEEGLAIRRELGDSRGEAGTLNNLACVLWQTGDDGTARSLAEQALSIYRALEYDHGCAETLGNLGDAAHREGDLTTSLELHTESLAIRRRLGDPRGIATALYALAVVAHDNGNLSRSAELHAEALEMRLGLGASLQVAESLRGMGRLAAEGGDHARAARLFARADAIHESIGAAVPTHLRVELERAIARAREALGAEAFEREWERGRRGAEA